MGFASSEANALPPEWKDSFVRELRFGIQQAWPYVWGGRGPDKLVYDTKAKEWARGVDCFFFIYFSAKNAGIPGIQIVTAHDMAQGKGGWKQRPLALKDVEEGDLGFVTWHKNPDRVNGHVISFLEGDNGLIEAAHASSGLHRTALVSFGPLHKLGNWHFSRLTIGD